MMYKWDPTKALQLIESEKITHWTGVPTMLQDLMEHPNFSKHNLSSLLVVGGGGAATPVSQVNRLVVSYLFSLFQYFLVPFVIISVLSVSVHFFVSFQYPFRICFQPFQDPL